VAETVRALGPAWNVVAIEMACAAWAIHRRGVALSDLGQGLRELYAQVLPLLPIGTEGVRIFDVGVVVDVVMQVFAKGRSLVR
jgi:histidine ammonia-lyase